MWQNSGEWRKGAGAMLKGWMVGTCKLKVRFCFVHSTASEKQHLKTRTTWKLYCTTECRNTTIKRRNPRTWAIIRSFRLVPRLRLRYTQDKRVNLVRNHPAGVGWLKKFGARLHSLCHPMRNRGNVLYCTVPTTLPTILTNILLAVNALSYDNMNCTVHIYSRSWQL